MDLNTFKTIDPGLGNLDLYLAGSNEVIGLTINIFNCNSINFSYPLSLLTSITFDGIQLLVTGTEIYSTHYYYDIDPIEIDPNSNLLNSGCILLNLTPNIDPVPFTYNVYNAIIGNSENIRRSAFVYDVDRKSDQIKPANIAAILEDSATYAEFQDSNYSDTGLINARYNGTKTSKLDYGTSPAFTGAALSAAIYSTDIDSQLICSQSIDQRVVDEYIFTVDPRATLGYKSSATLTDTPQLRYKYAGGGNFPAGTIQIYHTTFTVDALVDAEPGDILGMKGTATSTDFYEIVKLETITKSTSQSTLTVKRGYKQDIIDNPAVNIAVINTLHFDILLGDTLHRLDNNQIYRITNKKIWSKDQNEIFYVDDNGGYLSLILTCSI